MNILYINNLFYFLLKLNWKELIILLITTFLKIIFLLLCILSIEFLLNRIIYFIGRNSTSLLGILYKKKVINCISHFFNLIIICLLVKIIFPEYFYSTYFERTFSILFLLIFLQFVIRIINYITEVASSDNNHQTIAIHSFFQLLKVVSVICCFLIIIAILTKNHIFTVFTSLGTTTAIVILIFKDTILGFVSGIQMSSTKMIKVGDWIGIPKYKTEGTVIEINLISTKIENFDKTITNIPTYDLISTAVINFEIMRRKNLRRIKKSILFNIQSFCFCDKEKLKKYENFYLVKRYINRKKNNCKIKKQGNITFNSLTNIEIFRNYVTEYLHKHSKISQSETLLVRYLDPTPYGLPMELYCFVITSESGIYEHVQANIFEHLLTIAKEFNLEITQIIIKKNMTKI